MGGYVDHLGGFAVISGLPEEGGGMSERGRADGRAGAGGTKREDDGWEMGRLVLLRRILSPHRWSMAVGRGLELAWLMPLERSFPML